MESSTKRQLVGASVLVALAVIFLPMIFSSPPERGTVDVPLELPPRPAESGSGERANDLPGSDFANPQATIPHDPSAGPAMANGGGSEGDGGSSRSAAADIEGVPLEQGAYSVQVGSFRQRDNAYAERDRIRDLGMPAYVVEGEADGDPLYRVRVGPVMAREDAEALLERVQRRADLNGWIITR